ncbi:g3588 [Coccomyxa viridis]|uniref:G3588 protein n=1 Tax=Coccomyxa viridis TaxID=1274662 RepID=A0ABP1FN48_9CHLO
MAASSREPHTAPQATARSTHLDKQLYANEQPCPKRPKTSITSGASLVTSLRGPSSPRAAQGSRQSAAAPAQGPGERSSALEARRQSLSGEMSRREHRDVKRCSAAPQWQRAGSRLQRTDGDDGPDPSSALQLSRPQKP